MKARTLMIIIALVAFAMSASAQDPGAPDTLRATFTVTPNVDAGDSVVVIEMYMAIDETVGNISAGFAWDFPHFEMDSAVWTPTADAVFNFGKFVWANNNLDSTNARQLFQLSGLSFTGLTTSTAVCNFWGHVTQWVDGDTINIVPDPFVSMLFVEAGTNLEFAPLWGGDATIADVMNIGGGLLPAKFGLAQNYPNPFNPVTTINFDLPRKAHTTLSVFNVLGQTVATLIDQDLPPGFYNQEWNGTTDGGSQVASGIYFYRLSAGDKVMTKKMMLLK